MRGRRGTRSPGPRQSIADRRDPSSMRATTRSVPLTPLAEQLGATSGSVTDIYLPGAISRAHPGGRRIRAAHRIQSRTVRRMATPTGRSRRQLGTTTTSQVARLATSDETLPRMSRRRFSRGREPRTITSASSDRDASRMASAGSPSQMRKVARTPASRACRTIACAPAVSRSRSWSTRRAPSAREVEVVLLDHAEDDQRPRRRPGARLIASSAASREAGVRSTASRIRGPRGARVRSSP